MITVEKWFLGAAVLLAAGLVGQSAWSGKPERDRVDELQPKVKETKDAIKSACGCDTALNVKFDTYKTVGDMSAIPHTLGAITSATKNYCVKPADKKAFCGNVSAVEIAWASSVDSPKMEGKTLKTHTGGGGTYNSESQIIKVLNAF